MANGTTRTIPGRGKHARPHFDLKTPDCSNDGARESGLTSHPTG
jgi:hypothetical protein